MERPESLRDWIASEGRRSFEDLLRSWCATKAVELANEQALHCTSRMSASGVSQRQEQLLKEIARYYVALEVLSEVDAHVAPPKSVEVLDKITL